MPLFVHYLSPPSDGSLELLRELIDDSIKLTTAEGGPAPNSTEILISGRPERNDLINCSHLWGLIVPWAGVPQSTIDLLVEFPHISLHNLHHNAAPVAELAMALLLAAAKFIVPFDQDLRREDWGRRYQPNPSLLLSGKTALILGYGAIGRRIARSCLALGMRVLAVRRQPNNDRGEQGVEMWSIEDLPDLLAGSMVLVICLPLTKETEGLIGEAELALLPQGAVLVNVARGPIVDEVALYHALQAKHILGAGIDVWYSYPSADDPNKSSAPASYPFNELENVVLSPHRGGATSESNRLRMAHLAQMLNDAAAGMPLANWVDIEAGY